jgi:hypothetical protein
VGTAMNFLDARLQNVDRSGILSGQTFSLLMKKPSMFGLKIQDGSLRQAFSFYLLIIPKQLAADENYETNETPLWRTKRQFSSQTV